MFLQVLQHTTELFGFEISFIFTRHKIPFQRFVFRALTFQADFFRLPTKLYGLNQGSTTSSGEAKTNHQFRF